MKLGLVTDSPADLPTDLTERYGIEVVPAVLVLDGKSYIDGRDLSREEFYNRLPTLKTAPTTASPSIGDFAARYRKLFEAGCEHIVSIHTAEKLTALANIARRAAADFAGHVTVLESGSLTLGLGFQLLAAAEAIELGLGLDAVLDAVQSTRQRVRVMAALDTVEYLRRSGRVPAAVAALGGLLHIRPLVELREGEVKALGAERTTSHATGSLLKRLLDIGPLERLAVLHTNAEQRAREFLTALMNSESRTFLPREIRIVNVTTLIGTHVGPNGLGFAAVKA